MRATTRTIQLLSLAVCLLLLPGCAKKASQEIDFGTVENSVYRNQFFGFNLALPKGWSVQDQETRQRLSEEGTKLMVGDDKRMKAIVKASEQQTVNLLAVFEHPIGSPVPFNPSVICVAERLRGLPGIQSGKDYHYHARKLMESSQMKVAFKENITTEKLGGIDFDIMQGSMTFGEVTVQQKYHAAVMKDYALVFITSFTAPDQKSALEKILGTVAFNNSEASNLQLTTNSK